MHRFSVMIILFSLLTLHCSLTKSLTETEKAKLDLPLLRLLTGAPVEEHRFDVFTRADGTKEYAIIVRSDNPEEIKKTGVSISSIFGNIVVIHATVKEIQEIVSLPSVRSLETGSKNFIHPHK